MKKTMQVIKAPDVDLPAWRVLYDDLLRRMDSGGLDLEGVIDHGELRVLLDPATDDPTYYQAVGRAARRLRRDRGRSLEIVRGRGYRLIGGWAQVDQGNRQQGRARRVVKRGREMLLTVDQRLMDAQQRSLTNAMVRGMAVLEGFMGLTLQKIADHEEQIALLQTSQVVNRARQQATDDEIARLRLDLEEMRAHLDAPN